MLDTNKLKRTTEDLMHTLGERQTECAAFCILAGCDGTFLIETIECVTDIDGVACDDGGFHFIDGIECLVGEKGKGLD